jgi:hypothetical protein
MEKEMPRMQGYWEKGIDIQGGGKMYNQQLRIVESQYAEIRNSIEETGCFTSEMILELATKLQDYAKSMEHLKEGFRT